MFDDPQRLRQMAEEARVLARAMRDPFAKNSMLELADRWDRLAERAEQRAALRANRAAPGAATC